MVFLKHVPSGRIYPFNPDVAKADDMEIVDMSGSPVPEPTPDEPQMLHLAGHEGRVAVPRKAKAKAQPPTPRVTDALIEDDVDADEFLSGLGGK
jgi:hypothetical protein